MPVHGVGQSIATGQDEQGWLRRIATSVAFEGSKKHLVSYVTFGRKREKTVGRPGSSALRARSFIFGGKYAGHEHKCAR